MSGAGGAFLFSADCGVSKDRIAHLAASATRLILSPLFNQQVYFENHLDNPCPALSDGKIPADEGSTSAVAPDDRVRE
jgi:hypothetical protein